MSARNEIRGAALVYQCGIANVFALNTRGGRYRLMQADFAACEHYARGLRDAGAQLIVFHCDEPGDISQRTWERYAGIMFAEAKHPPNEHPAPIVRVYKKHKP